VEVSRRGLTSGVVWRGCRKQQQASARMVDQQASARMVDRSLDQEWNL
jgi:hypothetical protein